MAPLEVDVGRGAVVAAPMVVWLGEGNDLSAEIA